LAVGAFYFGGWVRRKWKGRGEEWWKTWKWRVWSGKWARGWRGRFVDKRGGDEEERRPLLVPQG